MASVDILLLPDPPDTEDRIYTGNPANGTLSPSENRPRASSVAAHVTKLSPVEIDELDERGVKPIKHAKLLSTRLARFVARCIDISWEGVLAGLGVVFVLGKIGGIPTTAVQFFLLFLLVLPIALLVDTIIQATFGKTLGKWLLGITPVTWRGAKLNFRTAFNRNFLFWRSAIACGFLPLIPFTLYKQYRLVSKGNRTTYDAHQHLRVLYEPYPVIVQGLVLLALLGVLLTPVLGTASMSNLYAAVAGFDVSRIKVSLFGEQIIEILPEPIPLTEEQIAIITENAKADDSTETELLQTGSKSDPENLQMAYATTSKTNVSQDTADTASKQLWANPYNGHQTHVSSEWILKPWSESSKKASLEHKNGQQRIAFFKLEGFPAALVKATNLFKSQLENSISFIGNGVESEVNGKSVMELSGVPKSGIYRDFFAQLRVSGQSVYGMIHEGTTADSSLDSQVVELMTALWRTVD